MIFSGYYGRNLPANRVLSLKDLTLQALKLSRDMIIGVLVACQFPDVKFRTDDQSPSRPGQQGDCSSKISNKRFWSQDNRICAQLDASGSRARGVERHLDYLIEGRRHRVLVPISFLFAGLRQLRAFQVGVECRNIFVGVSRKARRCSFRSIEERRAPHRIARESFLVGGDFEDFDQETERQRCRDR